MSERITHHRYTDEEREKVQQQYGKDAKAAARLAAEFGVKPETLRKQIVVWRKQGYAIPGRYRKPVGTKSQRIERGKKVVFEKTASGQWKRRGVLNACPKGVVFKPSLRPAKEPKQQKIAICTAGGSKQVPKPKVKTLPTRHVDVSKLIPVHIPQLKMVAYARPGQDVEEVRRKHLEHRDWMNKRKAV